MQETMKTERLANGLRVEFQDRSNRYYGDYHRVRIEVRCHCPLSAELFAGSADAEAELQAARALLGDEVSFTRSLEQMGVSGDDVDSVRRQLVDSFVETTLPYLGNPAFPARLAARELAKKRSGGRRP